MTAQKNTSTNLIKDSEIEKRSANEEKENDRSITILECVQDQIAHYNELIKNKAPMFGSQDKYVQEWIAKREARGIICSLVDADCISEYLDIDEYYGVDGLKFWLEKTKEI